MNHRTILEGKKNSLILTVSTLPLFQVATAVPRQDLSGLTVSTERKENWKWTSTFPSILIWAQKGPSILRWKMDSETLPRKLTSVSPHGKH